MKKKVLITDLIPDVGVKLLKSKYFVHIMDKKENLIDIIEDYDALICLLSNKINKEVISKATNLKIIANYAVGYNNIDVNAAKSKKIYVTNTPGVLTNATAEISFALMLTLSRRIIEADKYTREGKFTGWGPMLMLGDELQGKNLGIIGMGRIGQEMAQKSKAFGMNILYNNRKPVAKEIEKELGAKYLPLEELLKNSDFISIHCPLSEDTKHLINEKTFNLMKDGVYIINTSRGPVINENDLVNALKNKKIKAAGLDVYEFEPKITNELFDMENVILLPHIGSATVETRNKMSEMVANNVIQTLENFIPDNLVPELKGE